MGTRGMFAAFAAAATLWSGCADAQTYYFRSKVNLGRVSQPKDEYALTDVKPVNRASPDYRETSTPAILQMTCSNPSGSKCGGGGPLTKSEATTLSVSYVLYASDATIEAWWPIVAAPAIASGGLSSICRFYAYSIQNSLTGRAKTVIVRDADGNSVDNNCRGPN